MIIYFNLSYYINKKCLSFIKIKNKETIMLLYFELEDFVVPVNMKCKKMIKENVNF